VLAVFVEIELLTIPLPLAVFETTWPAVDVVDVAVPAVPEVTVVEAAADAAEVVDASTTALVSIAARAVAAIEEVTIEVPAAVHGAMTQELASALSTYLPFTFDGVRLRMYDVENAPAAQAIYPRKTSEFWFKNVF
jgi:hypothetical protein